MTLAPLTFAFPLMSEISRRPPFAIEPDECLLELEEEVAHRRTFYGRMVAQGKMSGADAGRHQALLAAILSDVAGKPSSAYSWDAKVRELRRELALRRNAWPKKIASPADPLDAAGAAKRMERLEAVHWRYWVRLDHWDPSTPDGLASCDGRTRELRAFMWRVDQWERAEADAGNPAARPDRSSAAMEAWFHAHPDRRHPAAQIDAVYLEAAQALGFAPREREAA
jgi:hypothetical protein